MSEPDQQAESTHGAEHLERWHFKPGESGNPGGRPKGSVGLRARLRAIIADHPEQADAVMVKVLDDARRGNVDARKFLFDQHDGPLALKIQGVNPDALRETLTELATAIADALPDDETKKKIGAIFEEKLGGLE